MKVLLLSMPDSFEHMASIVIRMPCAALTSLAGNIDPHHEVAVADLILVQSRVRATVEELVRRLQPDVVGLSVMTFQRRTAVRTIHLLKSLKPDVRIVVGGYDPSLAADAYTSVPGVDFIVRGEGDITFRELLRSIEARSGFGQVAGLSYRDGDCFHHNPARPVSSLDGESVRLPKRAARVLRGYRMLGRQVDIVETSRGCTFDCSFCSIIEMRGRNFHTYNFDRVIQDIRDASMRGARCVFIVDDNITLNIPRFESLCKAIVGAGLHKIDYIVQAMTSSIANHGRTLAPLMRRAGFRYVFLGIENILDNDLQFLRARAKNQAKEDGRIVGNASLAAIDHLHRNGMFVVGGLIVGNPDDTRDSIQANLEFARRYVDWPYIQHPTPYPGTPMTQDFLQRNLIINKRLEEYDGTTAVVRSEQMQAEDIEFMRWKAERWMKARHIPRAFAHDPGFLARNALKMMRHTFRGSSLKSVFGLESDWEVFQRYRRIRAAERTYL
jgi:anaerobic magnesium-protoporphyrin IX monomethyl ester cyclase